MLLKSLRRSSRPVTPGTAATAALRNKPGLLDTFSGLKQKLRDVSTPVGERTFREFARGLGRALEVWDSVRLPYRGEMTVGTRWTGAVVGVREPTDGLSPETKLSPRLQARLREFDPTLTGRVAALMGVTDETPVWWREGAQTLSGTAAQYINGLTEAPHPSTWLSLDASRYHTMVSSIVVKYASGEVGTLHGTPQMLAEASQQPEVVEVRRDLDAAWLPSVHDVPPRLRSIHAKPAFDARMALFLPPAVAGKETSLPGSPFFHGTVRAYEAAVRAGPRDNVGVGLGGRGLYLTTQRADQAVAWAHNKIGRSRTECTA